MNFETFDLVGQQPHWETLLGQLLTAPQHATLGSFRTLSNFITQSHATVNLIIESDDKTKNSAAATRVNILGQQNIMLLQGLLYRLHHLARRGEPLDLVGITTPMVYVWARDATTHAARPETSFAEKPTKFSSAKSEKYFTQTATFLSAERNANGFPLDYIIRPETVPTVMNDHQRVVFNAPLSGAAFDIDNKRVLALIKSNVLGTDAETWIRGCNGGREAWLCLLSHYKGANERENTRQKAQITLQGLRYSGVKNESNKNGFCFEKFTTLAQDSFTKLEECEEPYSEKQKKDWLHNAMSKQDPIFYTHQAKAQDRDTFIEVAEELQIAVNRLAQDSKSRQISDTSYQKRDGNKNEDKRSNAHNYNNNKQTRKYKMFSPDEWNSFSREKKNEILQKRRNGKRSLRDNTNNSANNSNNNKKFKGSYQRSSKQRVSGVSQQRQDRDESDDESELNGSKAGRRKNGKRVQFFDGNGNSVDSDEE